MRPHVLIPGIQLNSQSAYKVCPSEIFKNCSNVSSGQSSEQSETRKIAAALQRSGHNGGSAVILAAVMSVIYKQSNVRTESRVEPASRKDASA